MVEKVIDTKSIDQIHEYQIYKIKEILKVAMNSKFYKNHFEQSGINIDSIKTLEDFSKIPQITSEDLAMHNLDMLTVPISSITNIFSSGGTTGNPKIIFYDKQSWLDYIKVVSRRWDYIGITNKDIVGLMSNFDGLSLGGPTNQRTLEMIGIPCCCIGTSTPSEFVVILIKKLGITFLNSLTPTMLTFTEKLANMGYDLKQFNIKKIGVAGEPLTFRKRKFLEERWGASVYDKYGATEVGMFGAECSQHQGIHILENMLYFETVIPGTNIPTEDEGELVVTTLVNRAMPLIRYNVGDIVKITREGCKCGFNSPRIYVTGRSKDTIYLQDAVKLTHEHFDAILSEYEGIGLDYQVIHERKQGVDTILLKIEVSLDKQSEELKSKLSTSIINSSLPYARGVQKKIYDIPKVEFLLPGTLPRTSRLKVKNRVIDYTQEDLR